MQHFFSFDDKLMTLAEQAEQDCHQAFTTAAEISAYNQAKVLSAFTSCEVASMHLMGSTGYGYGDVGRDKLDAVFAKVLHAEDALVRHHFVSGTHAISVALFGVLRPEDTMVCLTGTPYDTMQQVIGLSKEGNGSLKDFGVHYHELALLSSGQVDMAGIALAVAGCKVAYIQRSRGYALRESIDIATIGEMISIIRTANPSAIVIVDNCYGEFVEKQEPTDVGADLIVGSLIKNPGGGIAKTGGYIAGRKEWVKLCAYRLSAVGMGKEVGCSLEQNREMFLGLFFAPQVVESALKTNVFALQLFSRMGYEVFPKLESHRTDIIGAIILKSEENLQRFCRGIQQGSPIDSMVTPQPWAMPGYDCDVIMAAGAFTMGASIELSADAPLKAPYTVFLQGGLTYQTGKIGILYAANAVSKA